MAAIEKPPRTIGRSDDHAPLAPRILDPAPSGAVQGETARGLETIMAATDTATAIGSIQGISRRRFVGESVLAGAALAGIGGVSQLAPQGALATEGSTPAPEPTQTRDVDVVVVGAGVGGLAAGLQAAELGLSCVVLEKLGIVGGTSSYAEGMFGLGSHWQEEAGVDLTPAEVLQKVMEYHHWMANAELTKDFFEASGETIAWLEEQGGVFNAVETLGPSLQTWHTYEGMGTGFTQRLYDSCLAKGVEVLLETPAVALVTNDGGAVCGVIAQSGDEAVRFNAKGVVLASGGYADNPDMINEYTMHDYDDLTVMGSPERTGDGIRMALELGADTHVLGTMMMCGGAVKGLTATSHLNVVAGRQPMLWVNENGERFANEGIVTNFSFTGNAMGLQKAAYNIIDGAAMDHIVNEGCYNGRGVYLRTGEPAVNFSAEFEEEFGAGNPYIFRADTVDELVEALGVDRDGFMATLVRYNELCEAGEDTDYGKKADWMQPIKEPPFYAFKLAKAFYCTVGGLKVNENNQVINLDGAPISGLYATGCDAGGLYGSSYDVGIAAGSQQGWTAHGGRKAVQHIASL